ISCSLISNIIFCSLVNSTISDSEELEAISLSRAIKKSLFLMDSILSINPFLILSNVAITFKICYKYLKFGSFFLTPHNVFNHDSRKQEILVTRKQVIDYSQY